MVGNEKTKSIPKKEYNYSSYRSQATKSKDLILNRELMKAQETKIVNEMMAHFKKLDAKKKKAVKKINKGIKNIKAKKTEIVNKVKRKIVKKLNKSIKKSEAKIKSKKKRR